MPITNGFKTTIKKYDGEGPRGIGNLIESETYDSFFSNQSELIKMQYSKTTGASSFGGDYVSNFITGMVLIYKDLGALNVEFTRVFVDGKKYKIVSSHPNRYALFFVQIFLSEDLSNDGDVQEND